MRGTVPDDSMLHRRSDGGAAGAAEKLRVGKAVAFAWTFTPLDVGMQTGIFAKHGLEIEASAAAGDAKMQQALTADSIDIGIGSGPGMAFMVKGVPAKAVAVMYGVPKNMAVMVGYNSPVKTVDDLKGLKLGVHHRGLADRLDRQADQQSQGVGHRRHHHGSDRRHAAGARRDQDRTARRLYRRARNRLRTGRAKGMARHHQRRPFRRSFHHARVLRARGRDRRSVPRWCVRFCAPGWKPSPS